MWAPAFVTPMIGVERGKGAWAAPILLFLAVLLIAGLAFNLANLDPGGADVPDLPDAGGTSPSSRGLLDARTLVSIVVSLELAALIVGVGYVLLFRRRRPRRELRVRKTWDYLGPLVSLGILALLVFLWPQISEAIRGDGTDSSGDVGAGGSGPWPEAVGPPEALLLVLGVLAGFLVLAYIVWRSPVLRRRPPGSGPALPRRAAAEAVRETIADLELGGDVRTTILACFQRFCSLLGMRGLRDQDAMTPREIEDAAIRKLRVKADDASALTALFEEARYSEHPLGEPARDRALRSLRAIRAALEA